MSNPSEAEDCDEPECTCYEFIGGHQPGCPHYGKVIAEKPANPAPESCPVCGRFGCSYSCPGI